MSPNTPKPDPQEKSLNPSILDEILVGYSKYTYTFYLTSKRSPPEGGHNQQLVIEGEVTKAGADWVKVRESEGYRTHKDHFLPLASILYFTETYRGEG